MLIFPAIDLYEGKAVRLYQGRYDQMTVYSEDPVSVAKDFLRCGAKQIHLVDLEGAKTGDTPNFEVVKAIKEETGLFCEIGGGVRSAETVEKYLGAGLDRVILGTAAVSDPAFLAQALARWGGGIAVGADLKDGFVAVNGWTQTSALTADEFFMRLQALGAKTVICTDISKDGAMRGANLALYAGLQEKYDMNITASGGVSSLEDIRTLAGMGLYGAIVGKAYYTGAIDLREAVNLAAC